jgi:transcriptional regulator with XRE-family HTH domain
LSQFPQFLIKARQKIGKSQLQVAKELENRGLKVSQTLVAQYEKGKIALPDQQILRTMAAIYGCSYTEIIILVAFDLLREKYQFGRADYKAEPGASYVDFISALVKKVNDESESAEMKMHQLRASAALFDSTSILDVEGNSEWQKNFPNLEQFWVVVPNFVELTDANVRKAVINNLKRGVKYFYFVAAEDLEPPLGRLWVLKNSLPQIDSELTEETINEQIIEVILDKHALIWLPVDLVIANPHKSSEAEGFVITRKQGSPVFSIKMEPSDLARVTDELSRYIAGKVGAGRVYG